MAMYRNRRSLKIFLLVLSSLIVQIGGTEGSGELAKLHEPCTTTWSNCTTGSDLAVYNCDYGEAIRLSDNCEDDDDLRCTADEICEPHCFPSESRQYDFVKMGCVIRLGEECYVDSIRECVEGAVCKRVSGFVYSGARGTCQCEAGTQLLSDTCQKIILYGKPCGSVSNCDPDASVYCLEGTCACQNSNMTYDPKTNRCLLHPGNPCGRDVQNCVPGSVCSHSYASSCVCTYGRVSSAEQNGVCLGGYDVDCVKDDPWHQCDYRLGLDCFSATCTCKEGTLWNGNTCLTKASAHCDPDQENGSCVRNAACWRGTCHCKDGYSPTNTGACQLSFGELCSHTGKSECNEDHGLSCVEDRCACADYHFRYNWTTLTCEDTIKLMRKRPVVNPATDEDADTASSRLADLSQTGHESGLWIISLVIVSGLGLALLILIVLFKNVIMGYASRSRSFI